MAATLRASKQGLEKVDEYRRKKGWTKTEHYWWQSVPTSKPTLKRFWRRARIQQESFVGICRVVGLNNWEEIVDSSPSHILEENKISQARWALVLSATLKEVDKQRAEAIVAHLQELLEDASLTLKKIEDGSVVLVLQGSREGFEWAEYLFRTGELTELLGVPVLDVRLAPVNLSEWLQNNFTEAIETGWQTIEEIFGPQQLAFRSAAAKRAKQIDLGDELTVALVADVAQQADDEIDIILWLYATGSQTNLPENLKLIVLDDTGEPLEEVSAGSGNDRIRQPLSGSPGDRFGVKIAVGDVSVTEEFVI